MISGESKQTVNQHNCFVLAVRQSFRK